MNTFVPTTQLDHFVWSQIQPLLAEDEPAFAAAYFDTMNGGYSGLGIAGGIATFADVLASCGYHAVLTDRRIVLMKCRIGAFAPLAENHGVTELALARITRATFERGFLLKKRKRLTLLFDQGALGLNCRDDDKHLSTQKKFLDLIEARFSGK